MRSLLIEVAAVGQTVHTDRIRSAALTLKLPTTKLSTVVEKHALTTSSNTVSHSGTSTGTKLLTEQEKSRMFSVRTSHHLVLSPK